MISLIGILLLVGLCGLVIFYLFQGPIYVPTHTMTVQQMVTAAEIKPGMRVVDLGSGDGRIPIAMAKAGAKSVGFEINPVLVWYSRHKIKKLGLGDQVKISTANFWNENLGEYDRITVFGITHVMDRLGHKLATELKPGAVVISNAFQIPELKEIKKVGSLLIYQKN